MKKGIFCISIDFELLWGRKDLDYSSFIPRVKKERKIVKKLLSLFRKYHIPATWAIVGKLYEPGNKLWSGRDIIKSIRSIDNQEIASHSYSHETFTSISRAEAEEEVKKNKAFSFVFPRNHVAHLALLEKYNFKAYRGPEPGIYSKVPFIYFLKQLSQLLGPSAPVVVEPSRDNKILNIPGSMYFVSGRGLRKFIPKGLRYLKAKVGIDKAIKQKKVFHIWFHPVDFADDSKKLFKEFEEILRYASQKRKEGKVEIKTMKEVAKDYL